MSTLSKSLADLDAVAEELLRKSEDVKPDDIAEGDGEDDIGDNKPDDSKSTKDTNTDDGEDTSDDKDTPDDEGTSDDEDTEDTKKSMKKSNSADDVQKGCDCGSGKKLTKSDGEDDEGDDINKCDTNGGDVTKLNKADAKPENLKDDGIIKGDNQDNADVGDDEDEEDNDLSKGVVAAFHANQNLVNAMKADSEFQAAVVESLTKSLGVIEENMSNSRVADKHTQKVLVKSLQAALTLSKSMAEQNSSIERQMADLKKSIDNVYEGIESLMESVDEMAQQPAHMRKSVANINVHDRNFQKSINGNTPMDGSNLSKSQVLSILNNELFSGNPLVTPQDIIGYESGAPLRDEVKALVVNKAQ